MLKTRLIPVLLLQSGFLVRSELFKIHQIIGNAINEVERFNQWNVDELIYLDITRDDNYHQQRVDTRVKGKSHPLDILKEVSKTCFVPLTWGGRIASIEDMRQRFLYGADKITINTQAVLKPELIDTGAKTFGNQAMVISIDTFQHPDGSYEVYIEGGTKPTGKTPEEWAFEAQERGAGEILLQCTNLDGTGMGYDLKLISEISQRIRIPLIACSGAGTFEHYAQAIKAGASAVAAANIWHFKEMTDRQGKRAMMRAGINARME